MSAQTTHYAWTAISLRRRASYAGPLDYVVFVAPLILCTTLLSNHLLSFNVALAAVAWLAKSNRQRHASSPIEPRQHPLPSPPPRPATPDHVVLSPSAQSAPRAQPSVAPLRPSSHFNQPFVTVYRAQMMLITIVCILAVDFPAFPRVFGKCETYGTSLVRSTVARALLRILKRVQMDLGVGSFVFTQGLISALPLLRQRARLPLSMRLRTAIKRSAGVLALGFVRVLAVKGTEYPVRQLLRTIGGRS
jgi:phosphatidylinositol glycan class W